MAKVSENDDAVYAAEGFRYNDVGMHLRTLSEQLGRIADLIEDKKLAREGQLAYEHGHEEAIAEHEAELDKRFRQTLAGLGAYRRQYNFWERVIVEFALDKMNYTQRDAAQLLGVGLSTVNRWAQNPLTLDDYR